MYVWSEDGKVASAEERMERALVVATAEVAEEAGQPAMEAAQEVMVVKSVVCVVMMGMTTAKVELGGMSIVAVIQISRCLKGADRKTRCVCFKDGEMANLIVDAEHGAIGSMNIPVTLL